MTRQQDGTGAWSWLLPDGLGSVRGVVNANNMLLDARMFTPYGEPISLMGSTASLYGFTGEQTDPNGFVHLRARNYLPELGVFPSLDMVMGTNRYGYVAGDPVNRVDPSGQIPVHPDQPVGWKPPTNPLIDALKKTITKVITTVSNVVNNLGGSAQGREQSGLGDTARSRPDLNKEKPVSVSGPSGIIALFSDALGKSSGVHGPGGGQYLGTGPSGTVDIGSNPRGGYRAQLRVIWKPINDCPGPSGENSLDGSTIGGVPELIYRRGPNKIQTVRLRRESDYLTGLSFSIDQPIEFIMYSSSKLRANGFIVRRDPDNSCIFTIYTHNPFPSTEEQRLYGKGHVTVYHKDQRYWERWYNNEKNLAGNSSTSSNSSQETQDFYALRE